MRRTITHSIALLLVLGHVMPRPASGEARLAAVPPVIRNVELDIGGVARGVIVDGNGHPLAEAHIELHLNNTIYRVQSDEAGRFAIPHLRGGFCTVKVGEVTYGCRLWSNGTAPPNALQAFLVANRKNAVVRGQNDYSTGSGLGWLNPLSGMTSEQLIGFGLLGAGTTIAAVLSAQDDGIATRVPVSP